jgi:1,4-dihydroxy-2-naphthoyl-CoA hydrolase
MATVPAGGINPEDQSAFLRLLGLSFEEVGPDLVVANFDAGPDLHQPWGIVHGGVFAAVIETVATTGAYAAVKERGQLAVGVTNITDFLRPHREGTLRAVAEPLHRGKIQQLWQVVIEREDGKSVARGQIRLQNIEAGE